MKEEKIFLYIDIKKLGGKIVRTDSGHLRNIDGRTFFCTPKCFPLYAETHEVVRRSEKITCSGNKKEALHHEAPLSQREFMNFLI